MTKRYNPQDNQSYALPEVLEVLQEILLEIDDLVEDWETLALLESYESTIDKHGNTIKVDTSLDVAARILLTPRETPETEPIQEGSLTNIDTSPPSPGITDSTNESTTKPDQIDRIPTAKEPQIEGSNMSHTAEVNANTNTIGQNDQNIEPSRAFAHPDHEIKLAVAKGTSSKNIIEGKRIRKPAVFHFKRIY